MLDGEFIEHVCDHSDCSAWNCMTLIAADSSGNNFAGVRHGSRFSSQKSGESKNSGRLMERP